MKNIRAKNILDNPRMLVYGAAILLLMSIILLGWTLTIQRSNTRLIDARPSTAYAIQQMVHSGEVLLSVDSVRAEKGTKPFVAPEGKHYVVVDLMIKNISDKPIQVLPSNDTYMKNLAGDVSYLSPFSIAQPFRSGELAPGEAIRGELSYLIDATGEVKLYIDARWSGISVPILIQEGGV